MNPAKGEGGNLTLLAEINPKKKKNGKEKKAKGTKKLKNKTFDVQIYYPEFSGGSADVHWFRVIADPQAKQQHTSACAFLGWLETGVASAGLPVKCCTPALSCSS